MLCKKFLSFQVFRFQCDKDIIIYQSDKVFYRDICFFSFVILICVQILVQVIFFCKGFLLIELYCFNLKWFLVFSLLGLKDYFFVVESFLYYSGVYYYLYRIFLFFIFFKRLYSWVQYENDKYQKVLRVYFFLVGYFGFWIFVNVVIIYVFQ